MKGPGYARLIVAGILFIGLLTWALAKERLRAPQEGEAFGIDAKTVTKVSVKGPDHSVSLEKQGDQWMLTTPIQGYADKDATERMVKAVAELKPSGQRKSVSNLNDPKYGLEDPEISATLIYQGGKTVTLYVGSAAPGGSEHFAKVEGRDSLYFVPASIREDLTQKPEALRDKTVARFEQDKGVSVILQYPDRVISFEKRGEGELSKWYLTQPYEARADEWNAKQVMEKLAGLRAEAFAPAKTPAGVDYGLGKPALTATVQTSEGKTLKVMFGATTRQKVADDAAMAAPGAPAGGTEKDLVYVQLEGRPETMLVLATSLTDLTKNDMDLRDKRILDIKRDDITELRVERKTGLSFTVRRAAQDWDLVAPGTGRANASKVSDLLWDLSDLQAREFLGEQKDLKPYGLDLPAITLTVKLTGGEPVRVMIGAAKGPDGHYCRTSQSDQVYVISDMLRLDLPKTAEELKDTGTGQPAEGAITSPEGMPQMPMPSSGPAAPPPG